jgi:hypothetical protein
MSQMPPGTAYAKPLPLPLVVRLFTACSRHPVSGPFCFLSRLSLVSRHLFPGGRLPAKGLLLRHLDKVRRRVGPQHATNIDLVARVDVTAGDWRNCVAHAVPPLVQLTGGP